MTQDFRGLNPGDLPRSSGHLLPDEDRRLPKVGLPSAILALMASLRLLDQSPIHDRVDDNMKSEIPRCGEGYRPTARSHCLPSCMLQTPSMAESRSSAVSGLNPEHVFITDHKPAGVGRDGRRRVSVAAPVSNTWRRSVPGLQ